MMNLKHHNEYQIMQLQNKCLSVASSILVLIFEKKRSVTESDT